MSDLVAKLRNPSFPPEGRLQDDARELMQRCFEAANRIEALEAHNARLREALATFLAEYVDLVNSGDAGFWDPEKEPKVIAARAAMEPTNE